MDYKKLFQEDISQEAAKAWRASGKKALGLICCHTPEEILRAADILPVRLRATGCVDSSEADTWMSSFSCSFARGILQYWMDGKYELDGMVASDGCMMAARIYDNAAYISGKKADKLFYAQIGAPRAFTKRTVAYYKDELLELVEKLEKLSGNKVTDEKLLEYIDKYNRARALLKQVYELRKAEEPLISGEDCLKLTMAYTNMPIEEYIDCLNAFLADISSLKPIEGKRARLMVIGSALDTPEYLKVIEDKGGIVVADALCYGGRALGDELVVKNGDVMGSIAEYYLGRIVCPRMIDNRVAVHDFILNAARDFKVDGVIYQKMQNCECWGGEGVFLGDELKELDIPLLVLEREQHMANVGQLAVRAEAFIEMIEKEG